MVQQATKVRKTTDKVVHITETVALITLIGFFFAVFLSQMWTNEARPVLHFGDPESIYADPARSGDITTVHLPLAVARSCIVLPDEVYKMTTQAGERLTERAAGGFPELGQVGVTQPEFRFETPVPTGLQPGAAVMSWRLLFDCGLRRVEVLTPIVPIEVLP